MNLSKLSRFMETFWLVVAIAAALHTIYLLVSNGEVTMFNYVFPIIAFVLHFSRKLVRKKVEKSKREGESQ